MSAADRYLSILPRRQVAALGLFTLMLAPSGWAQGGRGQDEDDRRMPHVFVNQPEFGHTGGHEPKVIDPAKFEINKLKLM